MDTDKPFHLEVKFQLCGAHLQYAGSKVTGNQTAQSDIFFIFTNCKHLQKNVDVHLGLYLWRGKDDKRRL